MCGALPWLLNLRDLKEQKGEEGGGFEVIIWDVSHKRDEG